MTEAQTGGAWIWLWRISSVPSALLPPPLLVGRASKHRIWRRLCMDDGANSLPWIIREDAMKWRVCYFYDSQVANYYYEEAHPMKPHQISSWTIWLHCMVGRSFCHGMCLRSTLQHVNSDGLPLSRAGGDSLLCEANLTQYPPLQEATSVEPSPKPWI